MTMPLNWTHFYIGLYSKKLETCFFSMNHWSECINIWRVTSFGHRLIKECIWQKPGELYRPPGLLFFVLALPQINVGIYSVHCTSFVVLALCIDGESNNKSNL